MSIVVEALQLPGVKLIKPVIHRDVRGFFSETYHASELSAADIKVTFVQDNHSLSQRQGVLRGLHFQAPPHAQDKLVRVTKGAIFDVAVDIRHGSPTYGQHVAIELSAANWYQLYVPKGFAHGFCTLEPATEVQYKVSDFYSLECDRGLAWDDLELGINWPVEPCNAILSAKDKDHPALTDLVSGFVYEA